MVIRPVNPGQPNPCRLERRRSASRLKCRSDGLLHIPHGALEAHRLVIAAACHTPPALMPANIYDDGERLGGAAVYTEE